MELDVLRSAGRVETFLREKVARRFDVVRSTGLALLT